MGEAMDMAEFIAKLRRTASDVLRVCAVRPDERVAILADDATAVELLDAFRAVLPEYGIADPVVLTLHPRRPAFADLPDLALVHQRHTMTPFGFVQIRSCHQDRQALCSQMCQRVPKFSARHGIDARSRFI